MPSSPEAAFLLNNGSYEHLFDTFKNVTDLPADLILVSSDNERIPSNKYLLSIFSSTVRQVLASYPYGVDPVILLPDYSSFSIKHLLSIINKGVTESNTFNPVRFTKDCEEISGVAKVLAIDLSGVRFEYIDDNRTNSMKVENDPRFDYKIKVEVDSSAESSTLNEERVELLPKSSNSEIVHTNKTDYMAETEDTKSDIFNKKVKDFKPKAMEIESTNIKDFNHKDVETEAPVKDALPKDLDTPSIHKNVETDAAKNVERTVTEISDTKLTNDQTGQVISSQFKSKKIFDCQICFQKLKHSCYHYVKNHYFDKIMSQTNLSQSRKVCPLCEKQCNNNPMLIYHISSRHDGHINKLLIDDGFAPVQKSELDTLKNQISSTSKIPLTNLLSKMDNKSENGNIEVGKEASQSQDYIDSKIGDDLKEKITSTKADNEKMYPEINDTEKNPHSVMDTDKSKQKESNVIEYSQDEKTDPKVVHDNFKRQEGGVQRETKRKMEQASLPDRKLRPRVSEFPDIELNLAALLEPEVLLNENKIDTIKYDASKSKFMNLLNLHDENNKSEKIVRQNKPKRSTHSRSRSEIHLRRSNSVKKDIVSPKVKSNNTATPKRSSMRLLSKPKIQYNVDSKLDDDDSDEYLKTSKSSKMNKSKHVDGQIQKMKSLTSNISATVSKGTPLKPSISRLPSSPLMSNFTNWNNQSKLVKSEPRSHPMKKEMQSFGTENLQKILGNISVSVIRPGEINENNVKSELEKRLGGNISISSV